MTKKISQLADAAATIGSEFVPIVQGGVTVKARTDAVVPADTFINKTTSQTKTGYIHIKTADAIDPCASPYNAPAVAGQSSYAAIMAAHDALPAGGTMVFARPGVYEFQAGETPVFTKRINIVGPGGQAVQFRKVGAGNGLTIGSGLVNQALNGITITGISCASEVGAGDALVLRGVGRSHIDVIVPSAAQAGVRMLGCMLNEGRIVVAAGNLPYGAQVNPVVGLSMELGEGGSGPSGCNGNRFYVVAEGCTSAPGYGINVDNGDSNFLLGASEGNTIGIRWGTGVHGNVAHLYMEGNSSSNEIGTRGKNTVFYAPGIEGSFPFRDGTAALPGMAFGDDLDTGFWRIAANRIGMAVGGTTVADYQDGLALLRMDMRPTVSSTYDLGSAALPWNHLYLAGTMTGVESGEPAAPAVNQGRMFWRDNGSGKTQLVVKFNTGAVQVIATEP